MLLEEWVKKEKLTLASAAVLFGYYTPAGAYNVIHGKNFPEAHKVARITDVTKGEVTANDLFAAWLLKHPGPYRKRDVLDVKTHHGKKKKEL